MRAEGATDGGWRRAQRGGQDRRAKGWGESKSAQLLHCAFPERQSEESEDEDRNQGREEEMRAIKMNSSGIFKCIIKNHELMICLIRRTVSVFPQHGGTALLSSSFLYLPSTCSIIAGKFNAL